MKKRMIIIISVLIIFGLMAIILLFLKNDKPVNTLTDDEIKFKEEYEKLNGKETNNTILKTVEIESDNNIKYVNDDEILDLLKKDTNVIYFGWADNNWCRTIVPILIPLLKEKNIDTLYYYDFKSLENGYLKKDKEKTKLYNNIINIIKEGMESNDKILSPTVVFIKDGKFIGLHSMTVESHTDENEELTEEEKKELKEKYSDYISILNANVCSTNEGC